MTKQSATTDDIMAMLSQFAESVDQRFESIDQRFESIDQRFESVDQNFESANKQFISIGERFDRQEQFNLKLMQKLNEHDARLDRIEETMATKDDIRRIESTLDGYAAKIDTYATEMAAMQHKIDRLESALQFLAKKTGISLETFGISTN